MAKVTVVHGSAENYGGDFGFVFTDPPFDLSGRRLANIFARYGDRHVVLIGTFTQIVELLGAREYEIGFDFVFDAVAPKQSRNYRQPNYCHATGVYLRRPGEKSIFDRRRHTRDDVFGAKGYWPTIFRAPREHMQEHGQAKNEAAIRDLLGAFDVCKVVDPFGGSGTTALAAVDLDIDCTLVERDQKNIDLIEKKLRFIGKKPDIIKLTA